MSFDNDWKRDFHRAVVDTILRLGDPSWQLSRSKIMTHITTIGIDYDKTIYEETNWQEFMGTLHEGDATVYGFDMILVLKDGYTYRWRYGRPLGRFLIEVLRYEPPEVTTPPTNEIKDRDPDVDWDYWASYGWCPTCYVSQGRCRDMRKPMQMFCKKAHPDRYRGLAVQ